MPAFHRFCTVIPFFIALALILSGCAGGPMGPDTWNTNATRNAAPSVTPYGQVYGETAPDAQAMSRMPADIPAGSAAGALNQNVKVAILLPLSGQHAALGQSMLQAAQLAVFDVGNDHFELMSKDTHGTPQGASEAAQAAMAEGAQLILGPLFAGEVRAVKTVTQGRDINMLAFSTDWTLAGGHTFLMGFMPFDQVGRIVEYAAAHNIKTSAVAAPHDLYGTTVSRDFEEKATRRGIAITRALSEQNGYDAVFIPAGEPELSAILMRIADRQALKLGTGLWDDPRVTANPAMNGAVFAAPSPQARKEFEQRYLSTYGAMPARISSLAYDATALAAALAKSGIAATGQPAFSIGSLTAPNGFSGVDGIMRFKQDGTMERGMAILGIQNGKIVEIDPAPQNF